LITTLPDTLEVLEFAHRYNQVLPKLPDSITHLYLGLDFAQEISFPPNLCELGFGTNFLSKDCIPETVSSLRIYFSAKESENKPVENIPISIKSIQISTFKFIHLIPKIPFGCTVSHYCSK
jgi:hypothetical protein